MMRLRKMMIKSNHQTSNYDRDSFNLTEIKHRFLDITAMRNLSLFNDAVILVYLAILFSLMRFQVHVGIIAYKICRAIG